MLNYKLLKLAIFFIYWLGFAPWITLILRNQKILNAYSLQDLFLQYTTLLFALILVYVIVHQVFEYFYIRSKIKRVVRKVTIRHQLKRLENGEIDLVAAQRLSTFTTIKDSPSVKRKGQSVKRGKEQQEQAKEEKEKEAPPVTKELREEKPEKEDIKKMTMAKPPPPPPLRKEPIKDWTKENFKKFVKGDISKLDTKVDISKSNKEVVIEVS